LDVPDHEVFCIGRAPAVEVTVARIEDVATRWGLSIVDGPSEYACPRPAKTR